MLVCALRGLGERDGDLLIATGRSAACMEDRKLLLLDIGLGCGVKGVVKDLRRLDTRDGDLLIITGRSAACKELRKSSELDTGMIKEAEG